MKARVVSHSLNDRAGDKNGKREDFSLEIKQIGIIKK